MTMKLLDLEMRQHIGITALTAEKKYYLIYARKSSEAEDRQVQSVDDQLQVAQNIVFAKNLLIAEDPFFESRSAKAPGRPEFNRLLKRIDQGDIKGIICWKLNRLSRNPEDEGKIRQILSDGRILEIITPEKTYTQVDSDFIMAIEGAQAQRFIADLKKDSARGTQSKIDKGIAPLLAPPGYKNDITKKQGERDILPHPLYFSLMRKIFDLALTGNFSVEQLHKKVKELKIKNSRNQIVSKTQLAKILRNPFYTGTRFMYAGKLYFNGIHKPMITDEEFDLLQDILDKRSLKKTHTYTDLLTGIMVCGECGASITDEVKTKHYMNGKSQTFVYYRCSKRRLGTKCSQPYIPAAKLEEQVTQYLESIRLSPRFVEWALKWLSVINQKEKELRNVRLEATRKEYDEVLKKIDRVKELAIDNFLEVDEARERKFKLEIEKKRLFSILTKIDTHVTEWNNLTIETLDFVKTAQDKWKNGTIYQRKTILKVLGSNLTVKDKQLHIELRKPFFYIQNAVRELAENSTVRTKELPVTTSKTLFLGPEETVLGG